MEGIKDGATNVANGIKDGATNAAGAVLDIKDKAVNSIYNKTSDIACNLKVVDPEWLLSVSILYAIKFFLP